VVLTEGRNRELRKMFAAIGHFAEKIRRVGYGPLELDVEPGKLRELTSDEVNALRLTAEGKMKPRAMRVTLPKEARRAPGKRGGKDWDRGTKPPQRAEIARPPASRPRQGPSHPSEQRSLAGGPGRDQGSQEKREREFDRPRSDRYAGKPGGFAGQRKERGPSREWKPRERTFGRGSASGAGRSPQRGSDRGGERPRFDKRAGGPPGAGSGFGARPNKPFGARPAFGGGRVGNAGRSGGRGEGGARRSSEQGGERGGERREWKPREQAAGGFENAPRKPFRAEGERPPFVRPEGSFKRSDGPKKRFEGSRGASGGKSFGSGGRGKERWVPRPGRTGNEEGRGQTGSGERPGPAFGEKRWDGKGAAAGSGRPKPAFGARPGAGGTRPAFGARPGGDARAGGFKRPGKPGGFARPGGFSRPGSFSKTGGPSGGANRGGARPGGRPHGGPKRG
jgi:23S rRNA pseudouridine2605 synthase